MKKIVKLLFLSFVCFSMVLSGCSKSEEKKEEPKKEEKLIGEEVKGDNVYKVTLVNDTGKDIKNFSIKTGTMEDFGENMLKEDDPFAAKEERVLYYDATDAIKENEEAQKDSEMQTTPDYTIQLVFEDDAAVELHSFPFGDVKKAKIKIEESIAYIEYTSIEQDKKVSTLESEKKIKQDQEAAALAAQQAAEQQAAEQQAQQEAAVQNQQQVTQDYSAQQPVVQQPVVDQPVQQAPQTPVQSPSGNGGSSANEGCLGDEVDTW